MWGKKRELPNVIKVLSNMMLELHNVRNILSNARKKNKGITKCDKRTVTFDVGTTQCKNAIIKCKKKNKGTTKCDKSTVTCDVGIA